MIEILKGNKAQYVCAALDGRGLCHDIECSTCPFGSNARYEQLKRKLERAAQSVCIGTIRDKSYRLAGGHGPYVFNCECGSDSVRGGSEFCPKCGKRIEWT